MRQHENTGFFEHSDTIGLVAPSFGAATEPYITRLAVAIRRFEDKGYKVVAAESVYKMQIFMCRYPGFRISYMTGEKSP